MKNFYFKKAVLSIALAVCAGVLLLAVNTAFSAFPSVNPPDMGTYPTFTGVKVNGPSTVTGISTLASTYIVNSGRLGVQVDKDTIKDYVHISYPGGFGNKSTNASALRLESTNPDLATNLEFVSTAPYVFDMGLRGGGAAATTIPGSFYFNLRNKAPMLFYTTNTPRLSIQADGDIITQENLGVNGALGVVKDAIFGRNVFVTNGLIVGGNGRFLQDVAVNRDLSVGGGIVAEGAIMAGTDLIAARNIQGSNNLDVTNNITAGQIGYFQRYVTDIPLAAGETAATFGFSNSPSPGVATVLCPSGFTVISCSLNIEGDPSYKIPYEVWPLDLLTGCYAKAMNYTTSTQTAQLVSICFNPEGTSGDARAVVVVGTGSTATAKATLTGIVGGGLTTLISQMDFSPITSDKHMDPTNLEKYEFSIESEFVPNNFGFNGSDIGSFGSQFSFP